jgi:hypothetical protein
MMDDLHRHLDGEVPLDALAPERRHEADAWDRMLASFRTADPLAPAPAWLEQRVMAEIDALPASRGLMDGLMWLWRPRPVRVSPLAAGLVVGALAAALLLPARWPGAGPGSVITPAGTGPGTESVVYVQFILEAPGATSVAVAGDFTDWQPTFALEDEDRDGVWSARVPVRPGVHAYMFVIDGTQWRTDPYAERYRDDGFGNRNAVLAVTAGA